MWWQNSCSTFDLQPRKCPSCSCRKYCSWKKFKVAGIGTGIGIGTGTGTGIGTGIGTESET